jgi:hypothetical protein
MTMLGNPLVQGALVGLAATQALDGIGQYWYDHEPLEVRAKEDAARNYRHVYEVAVSRMARLFGRTLDREEEQVYGWRFHKAFGLLGGLGYVALRRQFPKVGLLRGFLFGTAFFLLVDELMMPLLKWSPGPRKFNWRVHARGGVSHVAYGVAAESLYRALENHARP